MNVHWTFNRAELFTLKGREFVLNLFRERLRGTRRLVQFVNMVNLGDRGRITFSLLSLSLASEGLRPIGCPVDIHRTSRGEVFHLLRQELVHLKEYIHPYGEIAAPNEHRFARLTINYQLSTVNFSQL